MGFEPLDEMLCRDLIDSSMWDCCDEITGQLWTIKQKDLWGLSRPLFPVSPQCVVAVGGELTGMESVYQIVFGLFSNEGLM